jgi:Uma2 family endonuclease
MSDLANPVAVPQPIRRHKLSVEDFHKLGEAGVLHAESRVELFEGELVDMAPIGDWHAGVVAILNEIFVRRAIGTIVWAQNPVRFADDTELQPDVAVLRRRDDFYRRSTPRPADVLLLIEVADSTLAYDHGPKLDLYARHGIREVWIVNLRDRLLEVFREPSSLGYWIQLQHGAGDLVSALDLPNVSVEVAALC